MPPFALRLASWRSWSWGQWVLAVVVSVSIVLGAVAAWWMAKHALAIRKLQQGVGDTVFTWNDGTAWFRMDEQRNDVPLAQIALPLRQAVIAVEDHRFRNHLGIDPIGLARALWVTASTDSRQGGSTITQQLARTLFLSNQRTLVRKGKEAALAVLLEVQLSKDQILELYLNRVYLSSGVYGVEPLSQRLFGKPSKQVTLAEAALIAGLIQAPSALSPWSNLDGARERSHVVLARMRELGYITEAQEREAVRTRVRIRPYSIAVDAKAGYAKEYTRQLFRDRFGGDHPPDWKVTTTFNRDLQDAADRAVQQGVRRAGIPGVQAALVAIDPRSGDVVAMVGGRDFTDSPYNRAVRAKRQSGSAFKPFVYATALSNGWSPVSVIDGLDSVSLPDTETGEDWTPRNVSTRQDAEAMPLRQALLSSNNRAAVALQQRVGTRSVLGMASALHLADQPGVPSLALGTGVVSPLDLAAAYTAFAGGGMFSSPRGVVTVTDADGDVALSVGPSRERVLSPEVAFQVTSMLRDVVERGTGESVRAWGIGFPVAGKTGTTNDFKDAWFAGYSSSLVVVVWVGHDTPKTMGRSAFGARVAGPIWADFMKRSAGVTKPREFTRPNGVEGMELCRVTYRKPVKGCPKYTEYFKARDPLPSDTCTIHDGSFAEDAKRAIKGFFRSLWDKITG